MIFLVTLATSKCICITLLIGRKIGYPFFIWWTYNPTNNWFLGPPYSSWVAILSKWLATTGLQTTCKWLVTHLVNHSLSSWEIPMRVIWGQQEHGVYFGISGRSPKCASAQTGILAISYDVYIKDIYIYIFGSSLHVKFLPFGRFLQVKRKKLYTHGRSRYNTHIFDWMVQLWSHLDIM